MIEVDRERWSGEGDLTQRLLEALASVEQIGFLRVEDAPAGGADTAFTFISNEIYLAFRIQRTIGLRRLFGAVPVPAIILRKSLTVDGLGDLLARAEGIGPPDYADAKMLQYLRSERMAVAYQSRGPKLVEMVRIYDVGAELASAPD